MQMKKLFTAFILLALLPLLVPATHTVYYQHLGDSLNYNADVTAVIKDAELPAGGTLEAEITVSNFEDFPLADLYVIAEISNAVIPYPTQSSDSGVIFREEIFPRLSVPAKDNLSLDFSYTLPAGLRAGTYYLNLYLRTPVSLMKGGASPSIGTSPALYPFEVTSGSTVFPSANIIRTKTFLYGSDGKMWKGPVGTPVEAGSDVEGKVFITNMLSGKLEGLKVKLYVCEWDDTVCGDFLFTGQTEAGSLSGGDEKAVDVSLTAPMLPGAYSVRIELLGKDGLLALYRNRLIVTGGTAKIRKLHLDRYSFNAGDEMAVTAYLASSPDHYNMPLFEDFSFEVSIEDKSGVMVLSEKAGGLSLPSDNRHAARVIFNLETPQPLSSYTLCGVIVKDEKEYDRYCYDVIAADFDIPSAPVSDISVLWDYDEAAGLLSLSFMQNHPDLPLNFSYFISDGAEVFAKGAFEAERQKDIEYSIGDGDYTLYVTDRQSKVQQSISLSLKPFTDAAQTFGTCEGMEGAICSGNENCSGSFTKSAESDYCCIGTCSPAEPFKRGLPLFGAGIPPFILYLIAALAVVFLVAGLILRRRQEEGI
jgi:hypothetical protein